MFISMNLFVDMFVFWIYKYVKFIVIYRSSLEIINRCTQGLNVFVILRKLIVWGWKLARIAINIPNLQGKGFVSVWSFACVFRKCISVNFSRLLYPHINTQICVYTVHITQDLFIFGTFRECYNTMTVSLITATMHLSSH